MDVFRRCRQLPLALGMPLEIISKFVKKKKANLSLYITSFFLKTSGLERNYHEPF